MAKSGGGSSSGIFIKSGKILNAQSISGKSWDRVSKTYVEGGGNPFEIGIGLEIETDQTFNQQVRISGKFKNAGDQDWTGSAWGVKIFLDNMRIGKYSIGEDNIIPQDVLDKLIGKEVTYLRYAHIDDGGGEGYYNYKNIILSSFVDKKHNQNAHDYLKAKFLKDIADGYIKNFKSDESDTSFPGPVAATDSVPDTGSF
jgi:hypothetical protein